MAAVARRGRGRRLGPSARLLGLAAVAAAVACGSTAASAGAHVYWTDRGGGLGTTIGRADLDGSEPNQSFVAGASAPCGVAVDAAHVYWANFGAGTIGRADLDGSEPNQSFVTGASAPCGVAVDAAHVYWANFGAGTIGRANLDGSEPNQSFIAGASEPVGVAVDGAHVYWGNLGSGTIGRANLDGSEPNQSFVAGGGCADMPAVDAAHVYWSNACAGTIGRADLDGSEPNQSFVETLANPGGVAVDADASPSPPSPSPSTPAPPSSTPPGSQPAAPPDFSTAVFDGKSLRIRLRCPGRFKPRCVGQALAVSRAGAKGQPLSGRVSAAQAAGKWKVVVLKVKPKRRSLVATMASHPGRKQLVVRQLIHAKRFRHGRPQAVVHRYRVRRR